MRVEKNNFIAAAMIKMIMILLACGCVCIEALIVYVGFRSFEYGNTSTGLTMIGLMIIQLPVIYLFLKSSSSTSKIVNRLTTVLRYVVMALFVIAFLAIIVATAWIALMLLGNGQIAHGIAAIVVLGLEVLIAITIKNVMNDIR